MFPVAFLFLPPAGNFLSIAKESYQRTPLETDGFKTSFVECKSCCLNPAEAGNWRTSTIATATLPVEEVCCEDETDEDALDYNIIGVWLVCHRKYRDWSTEKSYDLAWILEFMQAYHMTIPRYIKRTKFYRKKMKLLLSSLVRDKDQSQEKRTMIWQN